jgi:hypothetical protein
VFISVDPLRLKGTCVITLITGGTVSWIDVPDPCLFVNAKRFVACGACNIAAGGETLLTDICPILSVEWITVYSNAGERWADNSFMIKRAHQHA